MDTLVLVKEPVEPLGALTRDIETAFMAAMTNYALVRGGGQRRPGDPGPAVARYTHAVVEDALDWARYRDRLHDLHAGHLKRELGEVRPCPCSACHRASLEAEVAAGRVYQLMLWVQHLRAAWPSSSSGREMFESGLEMWARACHHQSWDEWAVASLPS